MMGEDEEKGILRKRQRGRRRRGGGQDPEARWALRDPEVSNFILLFVSSSGCYATEN